MPTPPPPFLVYKPRNFDDRSGECFVDKLIASYTGQIAGIQTTADVTPCYCRLLEQFGMAGIATPRIDTCQCPQQTAEVNSCHRRSQQIHYHQTCPQLLHGYLYISSSSVVSFGKEGWKEGRKRLMMSRVLSPGGWRTACHADTVESA